MDDDVDPLMLGTGYALYRHGQDRLADQITIAVRSALMDWEPALATRPESGPERSEVGWALAPVDLADYRAPATWQDFIGQQRVRLNFEVRLASAHERRGRLPHSLLVSSGSGMGKRHLARLLAALAGARLVELVAPFSAVALTDAVRRLGYRDILFIDDIDRSAEKDGTALVDLIENRAVRLDDGEDVFVDEIAVIAGTSSPDALSGALVDCFPVIEHFEPYSLPERSRLAIRIAHDQLSGDIVDDRLAVDIAEHAWTPAVIRRFVVAARDLVVAHGDCSIEELVEMVDPAGATAGGTPL